KIEIENNIKRAAQVMLQVYATNRHHDQSSKIQVEKELKDSIRNIANFQWQVDYIEGLATMERQQSHQGLQSPHPTVLSPAHSEPDTPVEEFDIQDFVLHFDLQFSDITDQMLLMSLETLLKCLLKKRQQSLLQRPDTIRRVVKCLAHPSWRIRAQSYRIMRHLPIPWDTLSDTDYFEFSIIRSLAHDDSVQGEREQALKFLRHLIPHSELFRREGLVRMLIAVAERAEDKLRNVCLVTLCELLVTYPELTVGAGALRVLTTAANEGPWDISRSITATLLYTVDRPYSRRFVTWGVDYEPLMGGIHDAYSQAAIHEDRARLSVTLLTIVFNSWSGLHYVLANDGRTLRAISDALANTPQAIQLVVLRMFYRLFGISQRHSSPTETKERQGYAGEFEWLNHDAAGKRHLLSSQLNLSAIHRTLLLVLFIDAGLLKNLVSLALDKDIKLSKMAIYLIYNLLETFAVPLPYPYIRKMQELPSLFPTAFNFFDGTKRHLAADVLLALEKYLTKPLATPTLTVNPTPIPSRFRQKLFKGIRDRLVNQYDGVECQTLVAQSGVLTETSYSAWSWDAIDELFSGPFSNAQRLEDSIKHTTFFATLLAFYCPHKGPFRQIAASKTNWRYIRTGCMALECLVASAPGYQFLLDHDFLPAIREHLSSLTSAATDSAVTDNVFDEDTLRSTLSFGYFKFLNTLSRHPKGVQVLEHFTFYSLFYSLAHLRNQDGVIKRLVTHLYYHDHGHPRILLSQILTNANTSVRLFATRYLGLVLAKSVPDFSQWGVPLLLVQVYDPSTDVQKLAMDTLLEVCRNVQNLESLIAARPNFDHFREAWNQLKLLMVGVPSGFQYLQSLGHSSGTSEIYSVSLVEQLAAHWFHYENIQYAAQLEVAMAEYYTGDDLFLAGNEFDYDHAVIRRLADPFLSHPTVQGEAMENHGFFAPMHFFGQLALTPAGRQLLIDQHYLDLMVEQVTADTHSDDGLHPQELLHIKAALWAMGHIGSVDEGARLLEDRRGITGILRLFQTTQLCSLRGLCIYVLGAIASSALGKILLTEAGWLPTYTNDDKRSAFFVPADLGRALSVDHWRDPNLKTALSELPPATTEETLESDVMQSIGALCNNVLQNSASKSLMLAKTRNGELFRSMKFCHQVMQFIGSNHFRLYARRFIMDLFQIDLTTHIPTFRMSPFPLADTGMTLQLRKSKALAPMLRAAPAAQPRRPSLLGKVQDQTPPGSSRPRSSSESHTIVLCRNPSSKELPLPSTDMAAEFRESARLTVPEITLGSRPRVDSVPTNLPSSLRHQRPPNGVMPRHRILTRPFVGGHYPPESSSKGPLVPAGRVSSDGPRPTLDELGTNDTDGPWSSSRYSQSLVDIRLPFTKPLPKMPPPP
ncbi:hypothetical protein IWQ61_009862, partial [Dispira simplex]